MHLHFPGAWVSMQSREEFGPNVTLEELFRFEPSCVICIAAAFQFMSLFIFSMFIFAYFFTQTDPKRTVQRSALCRSRRELSNEYLLAKFGFDTAENEP